jgi:hypothetical protein
MNRQLYQMGGMGMESLSPMQPAMESAMYNPLESNYYSGMPMMMAGGGIANLLKFVVGEVQDAMSKDGMREEDLVGEATNLMGNFKNMAGFDPMSMFKNMAEGGGMPNMPGMPAEMGNVFENLNRTLGEELRKTVEKDDCMENMGSKKKE